MMMGGKAKAEANLDQLFREPLGRSRYEFQAKFPDSTSMIGEFSMANEPSLNIPNIYDRLGAPWKTQRPIRTILDAFSTMICREFRVIGLSAFVVLIDDGHLSSDARCAGV
jgi:putative alpha-1,2-mannosidase